jgi:hypothetical protein
VSTHSQPLFTTTVIRPGLCACVCVEARARMPCASTLGGPRVARLARLRRLRDVGRRKRLAVLDDGATRIAQVELRHGYEASEHIRDDLAVLQV